MDFFGRLWLENEGDGGVGRVDMFGILDQCFCDVRRVVLFGDEDVSWR
jgi:hypothetical protein